MSNFKMVYDLTQLEIPQYIDEPRYVRNKTAGYGLFFLGWLLWIWIFMPLITALLWIFQGFSAYEQLFVMNIPEQSIDILYLIISIMLFILTLIIWAIYNWFRFYNKERRSFPKNISVDQLALSFELNTEQMNALRDAKNVTLHYDQEGRLTNFELAEKQ
ncbi:poly-beta-1,6-N-acetyl-D-glucosamine biosynthesis protein PgaD [Acinetobacter junii]|uniref:poly-beta-1,6-N-acetyl-D-glucosamine biosynthesis protein PgaD n=1 Tax=Acinetobacter junii TaxID=40215 RepID=UPI003AF7BF17